MLDGRNVVSAAAISAPNLGQINVSQEDCEDWFLLHTVGKRKKRKPSTLWTKISDQNEYIPK